MLNFGQRILPHFEYGSGRTLGWGGGGVKDRGSGRRTGKEKADNNKINIHNKMSDAELHIFIVLQYLLCTVKNF